MANFVYGFYTIKSTKENIDKIINSNNEWEGNKDPTIQDSVILNTILPLPNEYLINGKENTNLSNEIIDWKEQNWGCKWDIDLGSDIIREDDTTISFYGRTPYSTPHILVDRVANEYDISVIAYEENFDSFYHLRSNKYSIVIHGNAWDLPEYIKDEFKREFGNDFFDDIKIEDEDKIKSIFSIIK